MVLSTSVLCTCCRLNQKDHNGACYFEEVSPGLPARARAVPDCHHRLVWAAILEMFVSEMDLLWNLSHQTSLPNGRDGGGWAVKQGPCCLSAEGAAGDHPQSRCMANPIFSGRQALPCAEQLWNAVISRRVKAFSWWEPLPKKVCNWAGETLPLALSLPRHLNPTLHCQIWHHQTLG